MGLLLRFFLAPSKGTGGGGVIDELFVGEDGIFDKSLCG